MTRSKSVVLASTGLVVPLFRPRMDECGGNRKRNASSFIWITKDVDEKIPLSQQRLIFTIDRPPKLTPTLTSTSSATVKQFKEKRQQSYQIHIDPDNPSRQLASLVQSPENLLWEVVAYGDRDTLLDSSVTSAFRPAVLSSRQEDMDILKREILECEQLLEVEENQCKQGLWFL